MTTPRQKTLNENRTADAKIAAAILQAQADNRLPVCPTNLAGSGIDLLDDRERGFGFGIRTDLNWRKITKSFRRIARMGAIVTLDESGMARRKKYWINSTSDLRDIAAA